VRPIKRTLEFDENERAEMKRILEAYKAQILVKRLNLKPMFQDFDITNCGYVTKSQFVRVLNQLGIMVDQHNMSQLLKLYMDKGNADEVNYFEFCNDVDKPEDMFGAGRDFNHSYAYFPKSQPNKYARKEIVSGKPDDIDDLLARIRSECKEKRIRLQEFMRDFDRLRSGEITIAQFRIGINMGGIDLSQVEFDLLVSEFEGKKTGHVKWKEFDDLIDLAFTTKGLEKKLDDEVGNARTQTFYGADKNTYYGPHTHLANGVVSRFKQQMIRERLDAKSFF